MPCWSVGRLIEVYEKCVGERFERHIDTATLLLKPILEDVLSQIEVRYSLSMLRYGERRQSNDVCNMSELSRMPCLF